MQLRSFAFPLLVVSFLSTVHAQQTVVDNLDNTFLGNGIISGAGFGWAQAFTNAGGLRRLDSITVRLQAPPNPTDPTVELWTGSGNVPTQRLEALGAIDLPNAGAAYANYTLTSDTFPLLQPDTKYWVVVIRSNLGSDINWSVTGNLTSTGVGSIVQQRATTSQSGNSWSPAAQTNPLQLKVTATDILTVQNNNDEGPGSLRQAIMDIGTGGAILFDPSLSGETITLTTGQIAINKSLTVDASALSEGLVISGNGESRIFETTSTDPVVLDSLSLILGKVTGGSGGAIRNTGQVAIRRCLIAFNIASAGGGAIASEGTNAVLTLEDSTFAGNSAAFAGGIRSLQGSLVSTNSTIAANSGAGGTGGIVLEGGAAEFANTIVAGNTGTADPDLGGAGTAVTRNGANLIGQNTGNYAAAFPAGLPNANGDFAGTGASVLDPLLAPLGDYGGPTFSFFPLPGSHAINPSNGPTSVNPEATDQRGLPRLAGSSVDIGAVEAGALVVTTASDPATSDPATSLREAIDLISSGGAIVFDPALDGQTITLASGQLLIEKSLTIDALALPGGITIDANGKVTNHRVMRITRGHTVALHGLTLTGGRETERQGGGISSEHSTLTLNHCTISGNFTSLSGGGIFNVGLLGNASLTLTHCTLADNIASGSGGGILNDGFGGNAPLTLTHCTLIGNSASAEGGGIFNFGSTSSGGSTGNAPLTLTHCTLIGNSASSGGGIFNIASSSGFGGFGGNAPLTLTHCTISGNSASGGGGGIYNDGTGSNAAITLTNSIIAANSANASGLDIINIDGAITPQGVNLLSSPVGSRLVTGPAVLVAPDPKLSPPGDYGGPTATMLPLPGSPALDAAGATDPGGTDQRGFPRFVNGALDIGAVEAPNWDAPTPAEHAVLWPHDFDGDGNPHGIEVTLGSNPAVSDPGNSRNLSAPAIDANGHATLTFGRAANAPPGAIWKLTRTTDLAGGSFQEIYRFGGTIGVEGPNITSTALADSFEIVDEDPPQPRAFYRFEAVLTE